MLKISIIIPTYNSGEFLEQSLLSILNQTHKNIELIIIDGKSTDNTVDIIKKYESHIFYWISEKDSSLVDATNKGLKHVTGDIITLFGSDDYYIENIALEQMANEFERNSNLDFLSCNANMIDRETGEIIFAYKNDKELFSSLNRHDDSIIKHIKIGHLAGLVFAGFSVRKSSISNYQFDTLNIVNDYEFLLYMWKKGCYFHYIDRPLSNVRRGGISHTTKTRIIIWHKFLINKKYFGFWTAIRKNSLLLYFTPIIQSMRTRGFRPFLWFRTIRSGVKKKKSATDFTDKI
jgi:glycosyltransferase involved in cell wall biosynthesis